MARVIVLTLILAANAAVGVADDSIAIAGVGVAANPIRRVVTLLQGLAKKIKEEGDKEVKLHEDFKCYCKKNTAEIAESISNTQAKIPQLETGIEESESKISQLKADMKSAQEDEAVAKAAIESATKQREGEHKEYVAESDEYKSFIGTLNEAISGIQKGKPSSFLQAHGMQTRLLSVVESSLQLSEYEKSSVTAFLAGGRDEVFAPGSEQVVGMFKTMKEETEKNLAEVESQEAEQATNFEELVAAKNKQLKSLREPLHERKMRISELALARANFKKDLAETSSTLSADQDFAADLSKNCADKEAAVEANAEARNEEMVALQDTIKILNDDDALDTFKKTLPGASLLQVDASMEERRSKALALVRAFRSGGKPSSWAKSDLDLLELALKRGKGDYSKVNKMIEEMKKLMGEEQAADTERLKYCKKEIAASAEQVREFGQKIHSLAAGRDQNQDTMGAVVADIDAIGASVKNLDASVADATQQRKEEHSEYVELTSSNHGAIDLLNKAKERMNQFYHPSSHPKTGLIVLPAWDGAGSSSGSFVQISSHTQLAHEAAFAIGAYKKKQEESNRVISMLDRLIEDLRKEVVVAKHEDEYSQKDFERMVQDAQSRRAAATKALVEKEGLKADLETALLEVEKSLKSEAAQKADAEKYGSELRADCEWLMSNYEIRKTAREAEKKSLSDTQAVLAGADYSLAQKRQKGLRGA